MHLVTLGLLVVFGGMTIALKDPIFVMWKPTLVNWLFAGAFLLSTPLTGKPLIERMMSHAIEVPQPIWSRLNLIWVLFFIASGLANLYVVYVYSGFYEAQHALIAATGQTEIRSQAVVLACGGFQSSAEMRARYLGPNWDLAKVRGTRFNTGQGIKMALDIGAMPYGHWSGCHAVGWDLNAPPFGDLAVGDGFQKHSYPWGIMVNARGERFVDEGADFRNYTYAKYGAVIHAQPNMFAWQIFDNKIIPRCATSTHQAGDQVRATRSRNW
jgi:hypothetical protein